MEVSGQLHTPATLPPGKESLVHTTHALLISALDGDEWSDSRPGSFTMLPTGQKARWEAEPVWKRWRRRIIPTRTGYRPPVVQSVA
jgi:hypothetical protein